jgi:hypothetical protein
LRYIKDTIMTHLKAFFWRDWVEYDKPQAQNRASNLVPLKYKWER